MTHQILTIEYDEGDAGSYRGVVLNGKSPLRFMTGDPQADWQACLDHAEANDLDIIMASSVTHFVFDNDGWKFTTSEDGREHLVPAS